MSSLRGSLNILVNVVKSVGASVSLLSKDNFKGCASECLQMMSHPLNRRLYSEAFFSVVVVYLFIYFEREGENPKQAPRCQQRAHCRA